MRVRIAVPLLAAVLLCGAVRFGNAAPDCVSSWGITGPEGQQVLEPRGLALDTQGSLYITDLTGHRLLKFRRDGIFLKSWGGPGTAPGAFRGPSAVAVNGSNLVFVADTWNHRIQRFTADGEFSLEWGTRGSGPGEFEHPLGIAVDEAGQVYVADTGNHRVQKFTAKGVYLTEWAISSEEAASGGGGGRGEDYERPPDGGGEGGPGLLSAGLKALTGPSVVATGPEGEVYVLEGTRISKFTDQGSLLAVFGAPGSGTGELAAPDGLILGPGDMLFVADAPNSRVQIYTPTGHPVDSWSSAAVRDGGGGGRPGDDYERVPDAAGVHPVTSGVNPVATEETVLLMPRAVVGDDGGHLYVVDSAHGAVFEFAYPSPPGRAICDLDPRALGCGVVVDSGEPLDMAVLGSPVMPCGSIDICSLLLCGGGHPVACYQEDLCALDGSGGLGSVPGSDGCADLVLRFDAEQVLAAAGVERAPGHGEVTLVGTRLDGTPWWGSAPVVARRSAGGNPGPRPPENYRQLEFTVSVDSPVSVRVYDVAGRLVRTLDEGFRTAGLHRLDWESDALPAGVYFYRIVAGSEIESRKVVILP